MRRAICKIWVVGRFGMTNVILRADAHANDNDVNADQAFRCDEV